MIFTKTDKLLCINNKIIVDKARRMCYDIYDNT